MKISYSQTRMHEAHISDDESRRIAIDVLRREFELPTGCFISEKNEVVQEHLTGGGSHSWFEKQVLRPASGDDSQVLGIITELEVRNGAHDTRKAVEV